jgi:hypothetical protein
LLTRRLGGIALLGGVAAAGVLFLPDTRETYGLLIGAGVIALVGAADDLLKLSPDVKLLGQGLAEVVYVLDIFEFRRFRERQLRRQVERGEIPALTEEQIERGIAREVDSGEFEDVPRPGTDEFEALRRRAAGGGRLGFRAGA